MNVLVACEFSGVVRDAFRRRGHNAFSCDLVFNESRHHLQMDAKEALKGWQGLGGGWDLVIAHPPCTYLCNSGWHWTKKDPGRIILAEAARDFFMMFVDSAPRVCIENPIGKMSTWYRKPDQIIQPYQFGDDASKSTCLWLQGLPNLVSTNYVDPRMVNGKPRWSNQTDSGQNRLGPSDSRSAIRSTTYKGIAEAMAAQWT